MDLISAASSLLELVKLGAQVYEYCEAVKDCKESRNKLLAEVDGLCSLLRWLDQKQLKWDDVHPAKERIQTLFVLDEKKGTYKWGSLLRETQGLFLELYTVLSDKLPREERDLSGKLAGKARNAFRALKWPYTQSETREKVQKLSQLRQDISVVIVSAGLDLTHEIYNLQTSIGDGVDKLHTEHTAHFSLSKKTRSEIQAIHDQQTTQIDVSLSTRRDIALLHDDVKRLRRRQEQDEFDELLNWVCPHKEYQPKPPDADEFLMPADWLFKRQVFDEWAKGRLWSLTLWARAGFGKTVLSSHIASYLNKRLAGADDQQVLSIYLKSEDRSTQRLSHLKASLLKQLISSYDIDSIPEAITSLRSSGKRGPRGLPPEELTTLLQIEISKRSRTYIIVDGLDESPEDTRNAFRDDLHELQKYGMVSLLFSSRQMDAHSFRDRVNCDSCREKNLDIFYTCDSEVHPEGFALCVKCALGPNDCHNSSHNLHEPYTNVDIELKVPNDIMTSFIRQLIDKQKSIGVEISAQAALDRAAGWSQSKVQTTRLGRNLEKWASVEPDLENKIISRIVEAADGSYMLAQLQWDHVRLAPSVRDIKRALKSLPKEFNDKYDEAMKRISKQAFEDRELGMRALMWVSCVKRVLGFDELQHALAVDLDMFRKAREGDEDIEDEDVFDQDFGLADEQTILSVSAGLLLPSLDGSIRLMHRSAYDYFGQIEVQKKWFSDFFGPTGERKTWNFEADWQLAMSSMAYLSHTEAKAPYYGDDDEEQIAKKLERLPFAAYASQYWGAHAAAAQSDKDLQLVVERFAHSPEKLDSSVQLSYCCEDVNPSGWDIRKKASPVHVLAWFGLHTMIGEFVNDSTPVDMCDGGSHGRTALAYACRGGDRRTIRRLLELGACINCRDSDGDVPISHAVHFDRVDAIRELCEDERFDIDEENGNGFTALFIAAGESKSAAIKALFAGRSNIDVNHKQSGGFTALMFAAMLESLPTLEAVLKHPKIELDAVDDGRHTALHHAASKGRAENVRKLLEHGADPAARGGGGETSLLIAFEVGHSTVIDEFFQNYERWPFTHQSTMDHAERGVLYFACRRGMTEAIRWLLSHSFDTNVQDSVGKTPLHAAVEHGDINIVRILLEHGADRKLTNSQNEIPADIARYLGYDDIVDLLEPDAGDGKTRSCETSLPTWALANQGLDLQLRERLSQNSQSALETNSEGDTALHIAIRSKNMDCVRAVLNATSGLDVTNAQNSSKRTPLQEACASSFWASLALLLSHDPPPKLDMTDNRDKTALSIAIDRKDADSAMALISAGAKIESIASIPEIVTEAAIETDNVVVIECLVKAGLEIKDKFRRAARLRQGTGEIMRLLIKYKSVYSKLAPAAVLDEEDEESESGISSEPESCVVNPAVEGLNPTELAEHGLGTEDMQTSPVTTTMTVDSLTEVALVGSTHGAAEEILARQQSISLVEWPQVPVKIPGELPDLEVFKEALQITETALTNESEGGESTTEEAARHPELQKIKVPA